MIYLQANYVFLVDQTKTKYQIQSSRTEYSKYTAIGHL